MALPSPTLAPSQTDYIPAGNERWTFGTTVASLSAPTSAELGAFTDYTNLITAVSGFATDTADVDNTTYGSVFSSTIPGLQSVSSASSWTMKADKLGVDASGTLTEGLNGYVARYPGGIVTGGKMSLWPVRIKRSADDTVAPGDLATITVEFSHPAAPNQHFAIPTA